MISRMRNVDLRPPLILPIDSIKNSMTLLKIAVIAFVGLLVGAAILFGMVIGPLAVIASPVLAIIGWFYIFPNLLGVGLLWAVYQPTRNRPYKAWMLVVAGSVGA